MRSKGSRCPMIIVRLPSSPLFVYLFNSSAHWYTWLGSRNKLFQRSNCISLRLHLLLSCIGLESIVQANLILVFLTGLCSHKSVVHFVSGKSTLQPGWSFSVDLYLRLMHEFRSWTNYCCKFASFANANPFWIANLGAPRIWMLNSRFLFGKTVCNYCFIFSSPHPIVNWNKRSLFLYVGLSGWHCSVW
jgi:hypothetical protein